MLSVRDQRGRSEGEASTTTAERVTEWTRGAVAAAIESDPALRDAHGEPEASSDDSPGFVGRHPILTGAAVLLGIGAAGALAVRSRGADDPDDPETARREDDTARFDPSPTGDDFGSSMTDGDRGSVGERSESRTGDDEFDAEPSR